MSSNANNRDKSTPKHGFIQKEMEFGEQIITVRGQENKNRGAARAKIEMADRVTETAKEFSQNSSPSLTDRV